MVKIEKFEITLTDDKEVYRAGDEVTGQLEIRLDGEMEMKEIRIKFAGKALVSWSEGKNDYSETEKFFKEITVVHGGDSSETERVSLPQGVHKYEFKYRLPQPLASSYQDNFGHIRYYVKARIVKPWQIDNKTVAMITVLDQLDLNHLENMMAPSGGNDSKNLCCCCCASGPIEGEVRLHRRGYVPGERIVANAMLENHSSSKVRLTSLELVQIVTYYAGTERKTEIKCLTKEMGPLCNKRQTVNLNNVKLQIPPVPPSEAAHCNIIDIQYAVTLVGHLRTCAINFRANAPIIVGTVPLRSLLQYNEPNGEEDESERSPLAPSSTTIGIQAPRPSYVTATSEVFGGGRKNDNELLADTMNTSYSPKYTYYDWDQTAFTYK